MSDIVVCPECRVPSQFIETHLWLEGGVIVQGNDPEHRMVLIECANLDPLFDGIQEIIGVPIEHIVIETKRRATRDYIDRLIPDAVKDQVQSHQISVEPLIEAVNVTARIMGYGNSKLVDLIYEDGEDDFIQEHVAEPYSILLWCGDLVGSCEAVTGKNHEVDHKCLSADQWELTARPSLRQEEFKDRLQLKKYSYIEGDIELERCPSCGGPSAFSEYRWDTDRGVIKTAEDGRRVAMLGPIYLETIFDELERELGEEIPGAVVEAQRRFSRKGIYSTEEIGTEEQFRKLLAIRGMGNLREMKTDKSGLRLRLQNATLPLMMAGLIQAFFETVARTESNAEWEMKEDGTLELEISPKA